jgi:hypothetical protein
MISLRETARRHDASAGYLSERVRAHKPVKGHDLRPYAVVEDGQIQGFSFPADYTFPVPPNGEQANEQANERRENPGKRRSTGDGGGSSTTEIMANIDEQLRSPNEQEKDSALKTAGIKAAQESASALTDALRENPAALPLLADPAKHATTLGMGLLAGWYLNRRFASVSGTITGALLAATAADVFIRRDQSILMGLFSRKDGDTTDGTSGADRSLNGSSKSRSDVLLGEDPGEMIERIMKSAQSTTN